MVSIRPEAFTVSNVITNKEFSIPRYQRSFTWGNDQVDDFMETVFDSEGSIFLGPMIFLNKEPERFEGVPITQYEVVDGQQRLTMLFASLAVLKNCLFQIARDSGDPASEASSIANLLQSEIFLDRGGEQRPRFTGRETTVNEALKRYVFPANPANWPGRTRGVTNSQGYLALRKAYMRLVARVDEIKNECVEDWPTKALNLVEKIRTQVYILKLEVSDLYDAYEIFVSMNSQGQPLAATDLMKTQLMKLEYGAPNTNASQTNIENINNAWETAMSYVRVGNFDNFMRHALCMQLQTRVTKADMLKKFLDGWEETLPDQTRVSHSFLLTSNVETAIRVRSLADEYGKIEGERGGFSSPRLDRLFFYLGKVVDTHRIYSLKVMLDDSTHEEKIPLIDAALTLAVRWVLTEKNKQQLENIWVAAVRDFDSLNASLSSRLEFLRRNLPSDADFIRALEGTGGGDQARKTVLLILEERLRADPATPPSLDGDEIHLEHVAPKNPTGTDRDEWVRSMRDIPRTEDYASAVENWGNLTLLAGKENKRLKTAPFLIKRDGREDSTPETGGYRHSTLKLNEYFLIHDKWNFSKIKARREQLKELALERFRINSA